MKTLTLTIAVLFAAISGVFANTDLLQDNYKVKLQEESYVDDVPFNTNEVVASLDGDKKNSESEEYDVKLEEEGYVNDVNFDTRQVVLDYMNTIWFKAKRFTRALGEIMESLSEKGYIDSSTIHMSKIVKDLLKSDEEYEVELEKEPYVNDVPFDTEEIVENLPS